MGPKLRYPAVQAPPQLFRQLTQLPATTPLLAHQGPAHPEILQVVQQGVDPSLLAIG